ncbi:MAG TPA: M48 family metalloprotease, partial [Thermodesulfovibrionia bacterium]|nr:M48 family metalloprotease [Thermodesulfovibrionia bacterium]
MRNILLFVVVLGFLITGCQTTSEIVGEIASQQAYQKAYDKAYKKGVAQGMKDSEARAYAAKTAKVEAGQKKQLFEGVTDVVSSTGEIDYESEIAIGETLALEGFKRYGMPVQDQGLQKYVNLVGNAVARNSIRPDIPYRFVVVDSTLYNAFACPGGIIFVSAALVKAMDSEAELAGVLAHEVAHVGHKHALQSIKRSRFFEGVGKISTANMKGAKGQQFKQMIGDLQSTLFDKGLDQSMEYEADLTAIETAYRTGYDPAGLIRVLAKLQQKEATAEKAGSWFSTHPPTDSRLQRCQSEMWK